MTGAAAGALEQIRRLELAEAQRLEAAADEDRALLAEVRRDADRLLREARHRGAAAADARYRQAIADAERQAAEISARAAERAEQVRERAMAGLDEAVGAMLEVVLAPPGGEV